MRICTRTASYGEISRPLDKIFLRASEVSLVIGTDVLRPLENELHGELELPRTELGGGDAARFTLQPPVTVKDVVVWVFRLRVSEVRDRKSTRLNSSHIQKSRMPSSA